MQLHQQHERKRMDQKARGNRKVRGNRSVSARSRDATSDLDAADGEANAVKQRQNYLLEQQSLAFFETLDRVLTILGSKMLLGFPSVPSSRDSQPLHIVLRRPFMKALMLHLQHLVASSTLVWVIVAEGCPLAPVLFPIRF